MHYFINNIGIIFGVPNKSLKEARKIAQKEGYTEYIGINKDDKSVIEWLRVFYPEETI